MVPFKNLSDYSGEPPQSGDSRKIPGGPLYRLNDVQALTLETNVLNLWTKDCRRDVVSLGFEAADVGGLIRELTSRDYRDSEWCENGRGAVAACDAYTLRRNEFREKIGKSFSIQYYLKFALARSGALLLIVSCHI